MTRARGSSLTNSPPIIEFKEANKKINIYLSEPLVKSTNSSRDIGMAISKLLLKAELMASKGIPVDDILSQAKALHHSSHNQYTFENYLVRHNLKNLYPTVCGSTEFSSSYQSFNREMLLVNQILSMACQLKKDIQLTNHKYVAHQLALLFLSLNQAGGIYTKFKKLIEKEFEEIKAVSAMEEPHLNANQKVWLSGLTQDVIMEALNFRKHLEEKKKNQIELFLKTFE